MKRGVKVTVSQNFLQLKLDAKKRKEGGGSSRERNLFSPQRGVGCRPGRGAHEKKKDEGEGKKSHQKKKKAHARTRVTHPRIGERRGGKGKREHRKGEGNSSSGSRLSEGNVIDLPSFGKARISI